MTINSINERCNMTYEHNMNQPMCMCQLQIKLHVARNPQLINSLNRNKNHLSIKKYSHIPFNN